jgi:predicted GNAT superfamily acetyltransferase
MHTATVDEAAADAGRVAAASGVRIVTLERMDDMTAAMEVLRSIWGFDGGKAPISAELLRAMAFAGGYVAGAFADGAAVGASAGFLGERDGTLHLHSHISGVVSAWQGRHVGQALKQHQRAWSLARGIDTIEWTFDPLVRRNAFFNLVKLGADIIGFEPSFYGEMHDAINAGDETDRAVVRWELASDVARAAARGALDRDAPGTVVLAADDRAWPVVTPSADAVLRAWIPADVVALRQHAPEQARAWRIAVRDVLGAALPGGYVAASMSRDGWYTLMRADDR